MRILKSISFNTFYPTFPLSVTQRLQGQYMDIVYAFITKENPWTFEEAMRVVGDSFWKEVIKSEFDSIKLK